MAASFLRFALFAGHPIEVAFSTRHGGLSQGPYHTLNLGFHVGDQPETVRANRGLLAAGLGWSPAGLVVGQQVHGTRVVVVSTDDRGRGALEWETGIPGTDGLVTASPEVALAVLVADCAAVVLYDPVRQALGLAHAGWRGAVGGTLLRAIAVMAKAFGSEPADLLAAIGPAIGPCCYEVGEDVASAARRAFPRPADLLHPSAPNRFRFDLPAACRQQLLAAGLRSDRIEGADLCTACHTDRFYSHRAEGGRTGRMAMVARLRET